MSGFQSDMSSATHLLTVVLDAYAISICYARYFKNHRHKPTITIDPTNAAGLPPDLPVATDADAASAGLMAGVSPSAGDEASHIKNLHLT